VSECVCVCVCVCVYTYTRQLCTDVQEYAHNITFTQREYTQSIYNVNTQNLTGALTNAHLSSHNPALSL
jgi:hypothetical protein